MQLRKLPLFFFIFSVFSVFARGRSGVLPLIWNPSLISATNETSAPRKTFADQRNKRPSRHFRRNHFGSWVLGLGSRVLNLATWNLGVGSWIWGIGSRIWDLRTWALSILGNWIPNIGYCIMGGGSWVFNFGYPSNLSSASEPNFATNETSDHRNTFAEI